MIFIFMRITITKWKLKSFIFNKKVSKKLVFSMQEKLNFVLLTNILIKVGLFQILVVILKINEKVTDC